MLKCKISVILIFLIISTVYISCVPINAESFIQIKSSGDPVGDAFGIESACDTSLTNNVWGTTYWRFAYKAQTNCANRQDADGLNILPRTGIAAFQYRKDANSEWRGVGYMFKQININVYYYGEVLIDLGYNIHLMSGYPKEETGTSTQTIITAKYDGYISGNHYRITEQYMFFKNGDGYIKYSLVFDGPDIDLFDTWNYLDVDVNGGQNNQCGYKYNGVWYQRTHEGANSNHWRINNPDKNRQFHNDYADFYGLTGINSGCYKLAMENEEEHTDLEDSLSSEEDVLMVDHFYRNNPPDYWNFYSYYRFYTNN